MNGTYRLRSHTVAVPAPSYMPQAYVLWESAEQGWYYEGPYPVVSILIGTEELSAPATVFTSRIRMPDGKERTHRYVDCEEDFDQHHWEEGHWEYASVALMLAPPDCAEWENIIVPRRRIVFSEEAAQAIVARRNAEVHDTQPISTSA